MRSLVFSVGRELSGCLIATYVCLDIEPSFSYINCVNFIGCISLIKQNSFVNLVILVLNVFS